MKKAMFLMVVVTALVMGSCSKKDQTGSNSQTNQAASLPAKAANYVATNYPDATIAYILELSNSGAKYIVALNTTEELAFNSEGDYLGDGRQYHNNGGHPGDTIPHWDTIFHDTTGCGGGHHGRPHPGGGHHGNGHGIPIDSLSSAIRDYISANYAGYTILHAEYDSLCPDGLVKEIMVGKKDSVPPLKLIFSATDAYLLQTSRIRYSDVPQAVKDYISANYSSYEVCNEAEKYILANSSVQYMVYLRQEKVRMRVRLQADGTLFCFQ